MDDILKKSTANSCTDEFVKASYNFQIENYDFKKALCTIPLYQNLMIKKIVDYTNGINFIDESIEVGEVDILRGLMFKFEIAKNPQRKLSGIIHNFRYPDPRHLRKSMGRYTSDEDKDHALKSFNSICSYLNDLNKDTFALNFKRRTDSVSSKVDSDYEVIQCRHESLSSLMCQITPKRLYCVLHQAVKTHVCEQVEVVIKEVYRTYRDEYKKIYNNDKSKYCSNDLTLDKAFTYILSKKSSFRKSRILVNANAKLLENTKFVNAMSTLGFPVRRYVFMDIFQKRVLPNLYKAHTLNLSVKKFKDSALQNLPRKITKEIHKIVREGDRTAELTESLRAACLEEMLIILDQWNTEYDLIQFADMYIKRTIKERYKAELSAVDKSIDNKKQKVSRLINQKIQNGRSEGIFISLHQAKKDLKKDIENGIVTGIKEKDVDNHCEDQFGTESLDLQLDNGFEISTEHHFEDAVIEEGGDEYNQVSELFSKLKARERTILTKLLEDASGLSEAGFQKHLKACLKDESHALNENLLTKFETLIKSFR
ncbi:hypothetical protein [Vibrio alfacsensis]|uniref:hypothetical protein n=2 Tax=Vibrio TaxID=662 RepID=UPI00078CB46B|nr:hypothetical protein [Vibrio alfacsensis]BAU70870.1 hypothetical protein [Vibrio sp. 04Ya108]BBM67561.1 hypothetical protein VA249_42070 [Vibrio alfacsensis]BCN27043.1 hypothetical protein VYA_42350 [Vibrio alfacsensis]